MILTISVFTASVVLTYLLIKVLNHRQILDIPNERSSHDVPVPKGGGIVIIGVFLCVSFYFWMLNGVDLPAFPIILIGSFILACLSFVDDLVEITALKRLVIHLVITGITISQLDLNWPIPFISSIPFAIEIILVLAWVWFINLFNFMDGIDGISAIEILAILGGLSLIAFLNELPQHYMFLMHLLMATTAGFLVWNWHKAKIFLGDVGSVPCGYIIGWFLILMMDAGFWGPALILPLYYVMDATITLGRRAVKKEKVWQAHKSHFYQKALKKYPRHDHIVFQIAILNLCLIGLAVSSLYVSSALMLFMGICSVALLLFSFEKASK